MTIIWADGTITRQWLQIKVLANTNTGLILDDVFYFGNAIGQEGNAAGDSLVDAADEIAAGNNPRHFGKPAGINDVNDYNRDQKVDAADEILARNNVTSSGAGVNTIDATFSDQYITGLTYTANAGNTLVLKKNFTNNRSAIAEP